MEYLTSAAWPCSMHMESPRMAISTDGLQLGWVQEGRPWSQEIGARRRSQESGHSRRSKEPEARNCIMLGEDRG